MSIKNERRSISLVKKYQIISLVKDGESKTSVAQKLGLRLSTVCGIWKKREEIFRAYENHHPNLKRLRSTATDEIDKALYVWYRAQVNANRPVTGAQLRAQAEKIAQGRAMTFTCTLSWMDRFKMRHDIHFRQPSSNVDRENFGHSFWPKVRGNYVERDIFTVKEIGLYFKKTPDNQTNKTCDSGEDSDERLTVCFSTNLTGTEKRPLVIIGNDPKYCKVIPSYKANKKSWVTMGIFTKELTKWNDDLQKENRVILLLVQYSPAFRGLSVFKNIKLGYFSQGDHPLEMVSKQLKFEYRKLILESFLNSNPIDLPKAIRFLHLAWLRITRECIIKSCQSLQEKPPPRFSPKLSEWTSSQKLKTKLPTLTLDSFTDFDSELVTSVRFLDDVAELCEPLEYSDNDYTCEEKDIPSEAEVLEMCEKLYKYDMKHSGNLFDSVIRIENNIRDIILRNNKK